jgi:hypothetical protein
VRFVREDLRDWLRKAELPEDVVDDVVLACTSRSSADHD